MEREPEKTPLAAEVHDPPHVEEDRPPTRGARGRSDRSARRRRSRAGLRARSSRGPARRTRDATNGPAERALRGLSRVASVPRSLRATASVPASTRIVRTRTQQRYRSHRCLRCTGVRFALDEGVRDRGGPGRLRDRRRAARRPRDHGPRHRAVASRGASRSATTSPPFEGDGTSRQDLVNARRRDRGPRHRVHVARRGEPRRRHVRPSGGEERDDGHPDVERRVRRAVARRSARRRLRRLLRARDRPCDQPDHRRARRPADGRLRGGPGADRRVRRRGGRVRRRGRQAAPRRADPTGLQGGGDHPRRRDAAARR